MIQAGICSIPAPGTVSPISNFMIYEVEKTQILEARFPHASIAGVNSDMTETGTLVIIAGGFLVIDVRLRIKETANALIIG